MSKVLKLIETKYSIGSLIVNNYRFTKPDKFMFPYSNNARIILDRAIEDVKKHFGKEILIMADVDFDGVASAYIMRKFIVESCGGRGVSVCINKERKHGIDNRYVNFINGISGEKYSLFIIVDSSTNCIEQIKNIKKDVLVIDHHEIEVSLDELVGNTADGNYCIINNEAVDYSIGNREKYVNMSGAQVVYEFLRYEYNRPDVEEMMLYNWVAVSLYSDVIDVDNETNQWYLQESLDTFNIEITLMRMMESICRGAAKLNKNSISFNLVPTVNSAIRMENGLELLDIVMHNPENMRKLLDYKKKQREIVNNVMISGRWQEYGEVVTMDLTEFTESIGMEGLVANKLVNKFRKTSIVYRNDSVYNDGIHIRGSFRLTTNMDGFRKWLNGCIGWTAEGHNNAFGFTCDCGISKVVDAYVYYMINATNIDERYITDKSVADEFVIDIKNSESMKEFITNGYLAQVALVNSRMTKDNQKIYLRVPNTDDNVKIHEEGTVKYIEMRVAGLYAISFRDIWVGKGYLYLYPDYHDGIDIFVDRQVVN